MSVIQTLLAGGGAAILGLVAWLWWRSNAAVKAKESAEARERAATGSLEREKKERSAGDILRVKEEADRRAREAADAGFQAQKVAAERATSVERQRTEEAASRGPEAMTERANAAIREGRLPRGKPQ